MQFLGMVFLLYVFCIFLMGVDGELTTSTKESVALYFGGSDHVPPLVNGTYGGKTEMIFSSGDSVVLNCTAAYPVIWTTSEGTSGRLVDTTAYEVVSGNGTKLHIAMLHINNISAADDNVLLRCGSNVTNDQNISSPNALSTAICLRCHNGEPENPNQLVYAIRSSMTEMTTTFDMDNIAFWVKLRRRRSFTRDLKARWYRRFVSQVEGEVTKLVEYSDAFWSSTEPPGNTFKIRTKSRSIVEWTESSADLTTAVNFNPGISSRTGSYTVNVTDANGVVYFSKIFHLTVIRAIDTGALQIYTFKETANKSGADISKTILQTRTLLEDGQNIEVNQKYLIVCPFLGNPLNISKASIFKMKPDCPPVPVGVDKPVILYQPDFHSNNGKSADDSDCMNFTDYTVYELLLPPRIGDDVTALSAIIAVSQAMQYGCMYKFGSRSRGSDRSLKPTELRGSDVKDGVAVTIMEPNLNEIIIGDNVTLRCITARPGSPCVFWVYHNTTITYGDDPGLGYRARYTVNPQSKYFDLTIFNITLNQSGAYTCRVQASVWGYMEEKEVTIELLVRSPEEPYFGPDTTSDQHITVTRDKGVINLNCDAQGIPLPKIKWIKLADSDQQCYNQTNNCNVNATVIESTDHTINVPRMDASYSGTYECKIYNRLGTKQKQFYIRILEPGQEKHIALSVCLAIAAFIALICAILAIRSYQRNKLLRPLKNLLCELRAQSKEVGFMAELDEKLPTNQQAEALPFDFRYEVAQESFSLSNHLLGSGAFGQVVVGYLKLEDGRQLKVAVKSPIDGMNVNQHRGLISEIKLMMHIGKHVNVLSLLGVVTSKMAEGVLHAILEFCEFGSLLDYVRRYDKVRQANVATTSSVYAKPIDRVADEEISDMDLLSFSYQIAVGMAFLSSKNIVHRDLALRNMLLTNLRIVRIADFGLALETQPSEKITDTEGYIAVKWMALESICSGEFTKMSDVWSYGVVLWELYTFGQEPYSEYAQIDQEFLVSLKSGYRLIIPPNCPPDIATLMKSCWNENQDDRPTFIQCQDTVANVGKTMSSTYWSRLMRLLETVADDLSTQYYNINQIISIKRVADSVAAYQALSLVKESKTLNDTTSCN